MKIPVHVARMRTQIKRLHFLNVFHVQYARKSHPAARTHKPLSDLVVWRAHAHLRIYTFHLTPTPFDC